MYRSCKPWLVKVPLLIRNVINFLGREVWGLQGIADANHCNLGPPTEAISELGWVWEYLYRGGDLGGVKVLQKSYYGRIKMIYIDPPYNTGSDSFIYPQTGFSRFPRRNIWSVLVREGWGGVYDEGGTFSQKQQRDGKFHIRIGWIWCCPACSLAYNLLKDDGVIFVSIDDNEQANLKLLMDEVFGEEGFIACLVWEKKKKNLFFIQSDFKCLRNMFLFMQKTKRRHRPWLLK